VTRAVFFDVDFTLIYPGPTFRGEGYQSFCARHGMTVDASRFETAVAQASAILDEARDHIYEAGLFHRYTAAIIRGMGGVGPAVQTCAEEIYDEWAANRHFELYDDVPATLQIIAKRGIRIGLISNTIWPAELHIEDLEEIGVLPYLEHLIFSGEIGLWKPNRAVFQHVLAALEAEPEHAVFVGDSPREDILGAHGAGMRAVWVRSAEFPLDDVEPNAIISELPELLPILERWHT